MLREVEASVEVSGVDPSSADNAGLRDSRVDGLEESMPRGTSMASAEAVERHLVGFGITRTVAALRARTLLASGLTSIDELGTLTDPELRQLGGFNAFDIKKLASGSNISRTKPRLP